MRDDSLPMKNNESYALPEIIDDCPNALLSKPVYAMYKILEKMKSLDDWCALDLFGPRESSTNNEGLVY
jgi:hypothetical protein